MGREAAIGVFDSGIGGLTVVREIMRQMPEESILYFGDTARLPYGSKSRETIIRYSRQIMRFLLANQVKAVVVACNTASAYALETIRKEFSLPILGVIMPGARTAALATRNEKVGVIGTRATINSCIYSDYLHQLNPKIKVYSQACPLLVPLVEEGMLYDPVTVEMAQRYTGELLSYGIDTLVMGCTHYPLLYHTLQKVVGPDVRLVNPAQETALELANILSETDLQNNSGKTPSHRFFVSDGAAEFKAFANSILPCDVEEAKGINIEKLG